LIARRPRERVNAAAEATESIKGPGAGAQQRPFGRALQKRRAQTYWLESVVRKGEPRFRSIHAKNGVPQLLAPIPVKGEIAPVRSGAV
jgi:hypothetical protein